MSNIGTRRPDALARFPLRSRTRDRLTCWREPGVIHLAGVVDATTRATFTRALAYCEVDPCVHALDLSAVDFFSAAGARCFVERGWLGHPHVPIIASTIVRRVLSMCEMEYLLDQHGWRHA